MQRLFCYNNIMKVLFICNGNVARSQESELFFNALENDEQSFARSGGVDVKLGKPIDPLVVEVMDEIGYDLSNVQRKFVDKNMVEGSA
jgi:protein-tyrosine-phosphatase